MAAEAEAACDAFKRGPAEHSQAIVDAIGAQFVKLRAVSAVVHRADQDPKSLTLECLEVLDMEPEPPVAFEQHDLAFAALPARSRSPKRIRQAVADRAKFTDGRVALRRPATHLGVEIGLMAAADDDIPILWNDRVDGPDHLARIQRPRRDVEWRRVRWLSRDAMRELFRAYSRRRRFANAQLLVEAGEDCLDADECIRSEVDVGGLLSIAQTAWGIVQLYLAGLCEVVPAANVVGQAGTDREHYVRGLVHLSTQRREVAAGGAESERMVVEKTARRQRVGKQSAATIGEFDHRISRAGPQHATATEDNRPLCRGQSLDGLGHDLRIGLHAPDLGLVYRRGLVGLVGHVFDLLEVVGNAQH